jgi:CheY-like chemotaxis protein
MMASERRSPGRRKKKPLRKSAGASKPARTRRTPKRPAKKGAPRAAARKAAAAPKPPLILVVDRDEHVRDYYEFLLGAQGYAVNAAAEWREDLVGRASARPKLVVTSLRDFDEPARRWVQKNARSRRAIPVLFLTAASEERIEDEIPASPTIRILSKPAGAERISKAVAELLRAGTAADLTAVL